MAITGLQTSGIVERVYLTLPPRFTRETSSIFYQVMTGIGQMFQLSVDYIDELWRQTNLTTATGSYVDSYIYDLIAWGRRPYYDDDTYKDRYQQILYSHNSSEDGIRQILIDILGGPPLLMYSGRKNGAFYNSGYFWNDDVGLTVYGSQSGSAFIGIIELSRKPDEQIIDELCILIDKAKAKGVVIYLKWPFDYETETDLCSGTYDLTESDCSSFSEIVFDTDSGSLSLLEIS